MSERDVHAALMSEIDALSVERDRLRSYLAVLERTKGAAIMNGLLGGSLLGLVIGFSIAFVVGFCRSDFVPVVR